LQSNHNKEESDIRKTITLPLGIKNSVNIKDLEVNKHINKIGNTNKISNSINKNRLMYEKIKKKLIFNSNNNANSIYKNYNNMKLTKNVNKNNIINHNINKTFNSSNTNNIFKNNINSNNNMNNTKKNDKKLQQYIAKINNYYNKYNLNSDNKGNKYPKNNFEILNKKRGSIDNTRNFNFNKYISKVNNQNLNLSRKDGVKGDSSTSIYKKVNHYPQTERIRQYSINKKQSFSKKNYLSLENLQALCLEIKEKKEKVISIFKNNKNVSSKEEAFYILSISPVLRLTEQLIFSRATKNLRIIIPTENILKNNKIFLNIKANELINEISLCETKIKTPFTASKIADITLNFITSSDEQDFKNFDIIETNKEYINKYYIFIKLLYILFNISYDDNLEEKNLKNNLFEKLKEKGFIYIRDYLYHIYIARKEDPKILTKIDIINNEIIKNSPYLLNFQEGLKICRFIGFSIYLIKEIINYANNIRDIVELKFRAEYFLDIVKGKIDKMENKKIKKNQKKK